MIKKMWQVVLMIIALILVIQGVNLYRSGGFSGILENLSAPSAPERAIRAGSEVWLTWVKDRKTQGRHPVDRTDSVDCRVVYLDINRFDLLCLDRDDADGSLVETNFEWHRSHDEVGTWKQEDPAAHGTWWVEQYHANHFAGRLQDGDTGEKYSLHIRPK